MDFEVPKSGRKAEELLKTLKRQDLGGVTKPDRDTDRNNFERSKSDSEKNSFENIKRQFKMQDLGGVTKPKAHNIK